MSSGIQMSLMIGPVVPVPVSSEVLDALTGVTITNSAHGRSGFQLTFSIAKNSTLNTLFLLAGGATPPLVRVVVAATVFGVSYVLVDGVVSHHQISPGSGGTPSTLTLTGDDLSRVMDYFDFSGIPYPAMPREERVLLIVAKYAALGMIPLVIPSILPDVPIPIEKIPRHRGKDLGYVKQLADEVGYVFYVEPGPTPGATYAYWGPEIKVGTPQPALNVDMDIFTNVESLQFSLKPDENKLPVLFYYNEQSHIPIPIPVPAITPLNPPLGLIPPPIVGLDLLNVAHKGPIEVALWALRAAAKSAEAVKGSGTLDVMRYGRPLRPRRLIGVRGAGTAFDGLYYVDSVTDTLKPGEYKQSFTLSRNGLVSTLSTVPS
jgi:hypothetical protein